MVTDTAYVRNPHYHAPRYGGDARLPADGGGGGWGVQPVMHLEECGSGLPPLDCGGLPPPRAGPPSKRRSAALHRNDGPVRRVLGPAHDQFQQNLEAVRRAAPLRRRLVPDQSGREGRARRPERRGQDHALPDDRRRGVARRRRRRGAEAADHRLLPPGRRRDVAAARSSPRRSPAAAASATCIDELEALRARDGRPRREPTRSRRILERFGEVQARVPGPRRLRARGARARDPARPRLRRRPHRRRRRHALGRLEDARRAGQRPPRAPDVAAARRADQLPRHRVDHLARELPARLSRARS